MRVFRLNLSDLPIRLPLKAIVIWGDIVKSRINSGGFKSIVGVNQEVVRPSDITIYDLSGTSNYGYNSMAFDYNDTHIYGLITHNNPTWKP